MTRSALNAEGVRFALSVIAALAVALGLTWGLPAALDTRAATFLPASDARAMLYLLVAAAAAAGAALLAYIGAARTPGRGRTAILGAILASAVALNISIPFLRDPTAAAMVIYPEARSLGALALTLPVMVALGAAFGAQRFVSGGLLAIARTISAHPGVLLVASCILGGWAGFTLTLASLNAAFHQASPVMTALSGCGLVIGAALGLALSAPIGAMTRRFATVA